jgi:hypothetical protein
MMQQTEFLGVFKDFAGTGEYFNEIKDVLLIR